MEGNNHRAQFTGNVSVIITPNRSNKGWALGGGGGGGGGLKGDFLKRPGESDVTYTYKLKRFYDPHPTVVSQISFIRRLRREIGRTYFESRSGPYTIRGAGVLRPGATSFKAARLSRIKLW